MKIANNIHFFGSPPAIELNKPLGQFNTKINHLKYYRPLALLSSNANITLCPCVNAALMKRSTNVDERPEEPTNPFCISSTNKFLQMYRLPKV